MKLTKTDRSKKKSFNFIRQNDHCVIRLQLQQQKEPFFACKLIFCKCFGLNLDNPLQMISQNKKVNFSEKLSAQDLVERIQGKNVGHFFY
jgi:hypothetical protein